MTNDKTYIMDTPEFEALCTRCGACCGALDGDPCEHLWSYEDGTSMCDIYDKRHGIHHTIHGVELECISIMEKLNESWPGEELCPYKKLWQAGRLKRK